jgi:hypothetical protein
MAGIFNGAIFNPAIFNTGATALTGFIPRGSVASLARPDTASATVVTPIQPKVVVTVPSAPEGEVE